jgi:hypothetical protein
MAITAPTIEAAPKSESIRITNDLSILIASTGNSARYVRALYPVPKSSIEHRTPIARSSISVWVTSILCSTSMLSVTSISSRLGSSPVRSRTLDTMATTGWRANWRADMFTATGTWSSPSSRHRWA